MSNTNLGRSGSSTSVFSDIGHGLKSLIPGRSGSRSDSEYEIRGSGKFGGVINKSLPKAEDDSNSDFNMLQR